MFSTKKSAEAAPKSEVKYLKGGIHDDMILSQIRIDKSPTGKEFIEFTIEKSDTKEMFKQTLYAPTRFPNQTDKQFQDKIDADLNLMKDIIDCYYGKDTQFTETETFWEYITWVKNLLNNTDLSKKLRVKAVYKTNGYLTMPVGSKYTFIEPMDVETSMIQEMPGDKFQPVIKADKEETTVNGTARFMAAAESEMTPTMPTPTGTDLPF